MNGQAKPETVDKVCQIVRKQLALPEDAVLTPETKFAELGADSLDTVSLLFAIYIITIEAKTNKLLYAISCPTYDISDKNE